LTSNDLQLTVAENLEFRSRFFGLGPREASRRAAQLLEAFGLADRRKAMSTDLSGGQAKRLLIARALVHRPDVLFLDEPTAGLAERPGVRKVESDGDYVRVFTREPEGVLGELVTAGSAAGLTVRDATQLKPSLETVFLTLTGREYRE
jgi:ABC-type phosphonate transport system ATPase subunit